MTHHHAPIVILAKMGQRWLLIGLLAFALVNPVTWALLFGVAYILTGQDVSEYVLGAQQTSTAKPKRKDECIYVVDGHRFVIATECKNVKFPGKQVPT